MKRYVVEHRIPEEGERYFVYLPGTIAPVGQDQTITVSRGPRGTRAVIVEEWDDNIVA